MSESETSKKVTRAIKAIDKLVAHLIEDSRKVSDALYDLKEHEKTEGKEE